MNKKKKKSWTFIDLFAGIGGFHVALHDVGASCVFASEWNDAARKTYRHNFNNKNSKYYSPALFEDDEKFYNYNIKDITDKKRNYKKSIREKIPAHNIICGGFPCQPFSNAGFKKGFNDPRGTLFYDILNIIKTHEPEAFFLENVSHFMKHDNGKTFETIKKYLIKERYSFQAFLVNAADYGVPQNRKRVFMIGFKNRKDEEPLQPPQKTGLKFTMSDVFGKNCDRKIGFTLRCGGKGSGIDDRRNWDAYRVEGKIVRINKEHGIKMMGFPDNFEFPETVSNSQAMRQLGNAVAVPAIRAFAGELIKVLDNYYA